MCLDVVDMSAPLPKAGADEPVSATSGPIVLKFGSSVLQDVSNLKDVVTEIYRYTRLGRKVVAVVSAFAGETDKLYAEAAALGASGLSRHAPRLIALGEDRSAALLAIACDASGLDARIAGARQLSLCAGGPVDDAHPQSIDAVALKQALAEHDVVIVPGFVAIGASGEPVLLGRGGTDLTAVCVAHALNLGEVFLIKDVDGVYDRDPAVAGPAAKRFRFLDWSAARDVAGKLLQPKSIDFAAACNVAINVRRLGAAEGTRVAARSDEPVAALSKSPLNVSVAGLGVIGAGAALRVLDNNIDYSFDGALVRTPAKLRSDEFAGYTLHGDLNAFLRSKPDIILDALPSEDAGKALIENALSQGVSIVSANKQAVAGSVEKFHALAAANGAAFYYSASVGGGAPMVETLRSAVAVGRVKSVTAILNGTVNFILSAMRNGETFDSAVRQAQEAGFAEPDPSADLSGEDAKAKISILCFEAFGREPDPDNIAVEALTQRLAEKIAQSGEAWKQLATFCETPEGGIAASVTYKPIGDDPLFSDTLGESNAMRVAIDGGRQFECRGKGAGRRPTVESLLAELNDYRRSLPITDNFN